MHGFQNYVYVVHLFIWNILKQIEGLGHTWRSNYKMVINRACSGHNLNIHAWVSKYFDTVVLLEEKKALLKHLFRYVEGQVHTWRSNYKMAINWACLDLNFYIYAWIQNNPAHLFIWNICSGRLKVKATLKSQVGTVVHLKHLFR